jgi:hypothetical protein
MLSSWSLPDTIPNMPPPPRREDLDKELSDYLGLKRTEREEGNTNAAIRKLIENLSDNLGRHILDDERQFTEIHGILASHGHRITTLEATAAMKPIPSGAGQSLPPPVATSTGSFKIPPEQWARIVEHVDALERDKLNAEAESRGAKGEQERLSKANDELQGRVKYILVVAGGVITVVGATATAFGWALHHFH